MFWALYVYVGTAVIYRSLFCITETFLQKEMEIRTLENIIIRKEQPEDYPATEVMIMRAFWNLHGPGCDEHFVAHMLRESEDYLPEFSRVAEMDGHIVGAIMYSKAWIVGEDKTTEIVTFGPLAVEPTMCNRGIGKMLLEETFSLLREAGVPGICIFGEPDYYPKHGFVTCDHFGITDMEGNNFDALMGYELQEGALACIKGKFKEAEVFEQSPKPEEVDAYSKLFPKYKKLTLACQWLHKEKLGRISSVNKNVFTIQYWEQELPGKLCGKFFKEDRDFPAVGDYVTFEYYPQGDCRILDVCERSNVLSRPSGAFREQVMVANVDYVFIVASLNENYSYHRIARYVSVANQGNITPVVILTKADLCDDVEEYVEDVKTLARDIRVHAVSAYTGMGLDEIWAYMQPDSTIVLLGSSGVGKSTLMNELCGYEVMKTGDIRERDGKGRHTTTGRQMLVLENGTTIIDTPGMCYQGSDRGGAIVQEALQDF